MFYAFTVCLSVIYVINIFSQSVICILTYFWILLQYIILDFFPNQIHHFFISWFLFVFFLTIWNTFLNLMLETHCCSVIKSCLTLWPYGCAHQALLSSTVLQPYSPIFFFFLPWALTVLGLIFKSSRALNSIWESSSYLRTVLLNHEWPGGSLNLMALSSLLQKFTNTEPSLNKKLFSV